MNANQFNQEVLIYTDHLFRFSLNILKDVSLAEDVVQETMIKLWDKRYSLENYKSIKALAYTITKNLCLDNLKKIKKLERLDEVKVGVVSNKLEVELELKDELHWIEDIISKLPKSQQMILHLKNIEDLSIKEIADIMVMKENTICQQLSRARKKIRASYQKIEKHGL